MESSSDWEESEPGVRRFRSDFPETARDNVTLKRHSSVTAGLPLGTLLLPLVIPSLLLAMVVGCTRIAVRQRLKGILDPAVHKKLSHAFLVVTFWSRAKLFCIEASLVPNLMWQSCISFNSASNDDDSVLLKGV
ncbi:uncharacterized protein LOC108736854 isoform X1 [Agrilus planipennis]|uniref:Uncharacterized protein LOC108736854 isoform X1 n=1 Tax=Agrilus planipennis TaxID=224129 RepID=A0A1W4WWP9_AGRPL|nr:uncharacterized protein LOC108736854 isoform X1 [Agrilus planipennis]